MLCSEVPPPLAPSSAEEKSAATPMPLPQKKAAISSLKLLQTFDDTIK